MISSPLLARASGGISHETQPFPRPPKLPQRAEIRLHSTVSPCVSPASRVFDGGWHTPPDFWELMSWVGRCCEVGAAPRGRQQNLKDCSYKCQTRGPTRVYLRGQGEECLQMKQSPKNPDSVVSGYTCSLEESTSSGWKGRMERNGMFLRNLYMRAGREQDIFFHFLSVNF